MGSSQGKDNYLDSDIEGPRFEQSQSPLNGSNPDQRVLSSRNDFTTQFKKSEFIAMSGH